MILRYLDAKILPGYAAIERGTVFGYCFFVYEGAKGVIGDLYVTGNPDRVRAVEDELLEHVIDTLQGSPGVHRVEAQLLLHPAGTASRVFDESGFQRYRRLFMKMPLQGTHHDFRALPGDFEIRPWQERDYQSAAALITSAYRDHVDSDINDQYRTLPGSLRFLNNIVRFPGCGLFDPAASFLAVHRPSQTNVGMILCSRVKEDAGHVTQVCLLNEYRGKGIGQALLAATHDLEGMREFIGADSLAFLSVDGIYRAMGFEARDPLRPQFTDHCFTGDYPTGLTDVEGQDASPRQLSLLAEAI